MKIPGKLVFSILSVLLGIFTILLCVTFAKSQLTVGDRPSMCNLPMIDTFPENLISKTEVRIFRPGGIGGNVDQNAFTAKTIQRDFVHVPAILCGVK